MKTEAQLLELAALRGELGKIALAIAIVMRHRGRQMGFCRAESHINIKCNVR
jgi:hypothetical protein